MSTTTLPRPPRRTLALAALAAVTALLAVPGPARAVPWPEHPTGTSTSADRSLASQVKQVRAHTTTYRRASRAHAAGYSLLRDAAGIACIDDPEGGMGVHLVNGDLVGDGLVRANTPEALVYEPTRHGKRLVAVEYVVFRKDWRAHHRAGRPHLFGRAFELQGADNRYGLPPFYELHLWAWKHNPSGLFDDWNPRVHCPRR